MSSPRFPTQCPFSQAATYSVRDEGAPDELTLRWRGRVGASSMIDLNVRGGPEGSDLTVATTLRPSRQGARCTIQQSSHIEEGGEATGPTLDGGGRVRSGAARSASASSTV